MTTETNAERLESAKRLITAVRKANSVDDPEKFWSSLLDLFGFGYLDVLLQQSELAQELEASNNRLVQVALNRQRYIDKINSENALLREALWQLDDSIDAELATEIRPTGRITLKNQIGRALKGKSD